MFVIGRRYRTLFDIGILMHQPIDVNRHRHEPVAGIRRHLQICEGKE